MYVLVIAGVVVIYGSYSCEASGAARGQDCLNFYWHGNHYVIATYVIQWGPGLKGQLCVVCHIQYKSKKSVRIYLSGLSNYSVATQWLLRMRT